MTDYTIAQRIAKAAGLNPEDIISLTFHHHVEGEPHSQSPCLTCKTTA